MPPFHAYAVEQDVMVNSGHLDQGFTITFSSRDVADEWWRAIVKEQKEQKSLSAVAASLTRITPQYYTYKGAAPVADTISALLIVTRNLRGFEGNVFMTQMPWNQLFVLPDATMRDHVNNETFFIRCKREPTMYWYVDYSGCIRASHSDRAKFRISIAGDDSADDATIMIGSDHVSLAAVSSKAESSRSGPVGTNAKEELVVGSSVRTFPFSAFKNGFEVQSIAILMKSIQATAIVCAKDGEEWELV